MTIYLGSGRVSKLLMDADLNMGAFKITLGPTQTVDGRDVSEQSPTTLFGSGGDGDYDLTGSWDVSTAVGPQNFPVAAQETSPRCLKFKSDGTKMYVIGNDADNVNEYDLSTPWDINTAVYLQLFSVAAQESSPRSLTFKTDGSKMYVVGYIGEDVIEYDLSTPWDVTSAVYSQNFAVSAQETTPVGLTFKTDGSKMYVLGWTGVDVNEYNLSTPWDVSSAVYSQNFSVSAQESNPTNLTFKADGSKMYVLGTAGDDVNEYDLSTPWSVSSAVYSQNFSVSAQESDPRGLTFKPDGTKMYVVGIDADSVKNYDLSTPWDVSTAVILQFYSVAAQQVNPMSIFFKPDGTKMYILGYTDYEINEYDLSTPWDVTTAVYSQWIQISAQDTVPTGLFFKPDGTKMYMIGSNNDDVYEYNLSIPWDISTASYLQNFSVGVKESDPQDLFFKPDGTKMYVIGYDSDNVNEYDLSTPWDISTAVYLQLFSVATQETSPTSLSFKPDGTKMYVIGTAGDDVNEYDLSTPWDVTTAVYSQLFSIATEEVNPKGLFLKSNGMKMYVIGTDSDGVYEYNLTGGDENLNQIKFYDNLDVETHTLTPSTNSYLIIFVKGTLTVGAGGSINVNAKGGAGGAGGAAVSSANGNNGVVGTQKVFGVAGTGGQGGNGYNVGVAGTGSSSGGGGGGTSGGSRNGGDGEGVAAGTLDADKGIAFLKYLDYLTANNIGNGGAGGGSGASNVATASGAGGAGGAGGGVLVIFADTIVNNGSISANAVDGAAGGSHTGGVADVSAGGGGGGGNGGLVRILCRHYSGNDPTATGGAAGANGTTNGAGARNGAAGTAGNTGLVVVEVE